MNNSVDNGQIFRPLYDELKTNEAPRARMNERVVRSAVLVFSILFLLSCAPSPVNAQAAVDGVGASATPPLTETIQPTGTAVSVGVELIPNVGGGDEQIQTVAAKTPGLEKTLEAAETVVANTSGPLNTRTSVSPGVTETPSVSATVVPDPEIPTRESGFSPKVVEYEGIVDGRVVKFLLGTSGYDGVIDGIEPNSKFQGANDAIARAIDLALKGAMKGRGGEDGKLPLLVWDSEKGDGTLVKATADINKPVSIVLGKERKGINTSIYTPATEQLYCEFIVDPMTGALTVVVNRPSGLAKGPVTNSRFASDVATCLNALSAPDVVVDQRNIRDAQDYVAAVGKWIGENSPVRIEDALIVDVVGKGVALNVVFP